MQLCFDGLNRLHLGFVDPADNKPYDFVFDNTDTDQLAMFLYPRARDKIYGRELATTTQFFCNELEKELTDGSTPSSGTTENEQGKR